MPLAAALVLAASAAPHPGVVASAEAHVEIVRADTLTAENADAERGEAARVHRDANGTDWVEFV